MIPKNTMSVKKCIANIYNKAHWLYLAVRHCLGKYIYHPLHYYCHYRSIIQIYKQILCELTNIPALKGTVYLFQHSYYTFDGTQYISGGGERYARDLAKLIFQAGYSPVLLQKGLTASPKIWVKKNNGLTVIGIPGKSYWYPRIISLLPQPALAIYSGYVDFGEKVFCPNILISHGITWDCPQNNINSKRILNMLKNANCLVSVDTNTISWLRTTYPHYLKNNPKDMLYIPNYVDWNLYRQQECAVKASSQINVLFPRRLCDERGFWIVNSILPDLLMKYMNLIFTFVGFIHSEDIGKAVAELQQQFPGKVFHKVCDADRMIDEYAAADIAIIPTLYSEGTSLSCIEAMACGKAVITTNVGGLTNLVIDHYNGLLINPDERELAFALEKLIDDPALRKELGKNAQEVAKVFSKERWDERWIKLLQTALKREDNQP